MDMMGIGILYYISILSILYKYIYIERCRGDGMDIFDGDTLWLCQNSY